MTGGLLICSVSVWHALDRSGKGPVTEAEDGPRLRQSFPTGGGYGLGWVLLSPPPSTIPTVHPCKPQGLPCHISKGMASHRALPTETCRLPSQQGSRAVLSGPRCTHVLAQPVCSLHP